MYLYFLYNRIFFFFFIAKVETCVFFFCYCTQTRRIVSSFTKIQ